MGCDCCKIHEPDQYEKCQALQEKYNNKNTSITAPCGGCEIGGGYHHGGSNYTPPKKKRKKRRK